MFPLWTFLQEQESFEMFSKGGT